MGWVCARRSGRNTPTSAGRTRRGAGGPSNGAEHPRVGGEDATPSARPAGHSGTPPRRRGGRRRPWCGPCNAGTPPRRRGGRLRIRLRLQLHRNTRASAGRTPGSTRPPCRSSEHPRVGGEDGSAVRADTDLGGTPPRRRGGPHGDLGVAEGCRNTPASAGRTPHPEQTRVDGSEHPRVGGEDCAAMRRPSVGSGTPPRRRGGRVPGVEGHRPGTEHPRVGGEDGSCSPSPGRSAGTPPRRRGGLQLTIEQARVLRNTPASAGRTLPMYAIFM